MTHARAIADSKIVVICHPHDDGMTVFSRRHDMPIREVIRKAVWKVVEAEKLGNPNVWFHKFPHNVSVRPSDDPTARGEYVYSIYRTDK